MYFPNTSKASDLLYETLSIIKSPVIGVTSGCFDILHPLHVQYLEKCKNNCDYLVVGVDSDRLIHEYKNKLPVYPEHDRAYMIGSLSVVGLAFIMDSLADLGEVLGTLSMQYRKDKDAEVHLYKAKEEYYNNPVLKITGVKLYLIPDVYPINSTTELVRFIQTDYQKL